MDKNKFVIEFELNASQKMLYPYINTAQGLAEWFADKVDFEEDKIFYFEWDGARHKAKKVSQKMNQLVKFEFPDTKNEDGKDAAYLEFQLDTNELTQTSFLKIIDYSEFEDSKDMEELWNNLIQNLKDKVGG
ncbi:START-like domain-containing protein [Cytophagaceae bacterium ABcell3]|nr:START-like domain-containing protein [Cytophagaceae bacterium ABcell3]